VGNLVKWLSPWHSITDKDCKSLVFDICQEIAQQSDDGRKALLDAGVLSELISLTRSSGSAEVISACKVLKALAHTGTFTNETVFAGVKDAMESITSYSPFRRSTLSKEDKQRARACAKEVLDTLKSSKRQSSCSPAQSFTTPRIHRSVSDDSRASEAEPVSPSRQNASPSDTSSSPAVDEPSEPLPVRHVRHARSLSDARSLPSRPEGTRLAAVEEDETASIVEENSNSSTTRPQQPTIPLNSRRLQVDDHLLSEEEDPGISHHITPPSYSRGSVSRLFRRQTQHTEDPPDFRSTLGPEESANLRERNVSPSPSHKLMSSIGTVRRR